jgi:MFS family permease
MIGLVLVVAFAALDNVALVVLAQETLGARATGYGALASAYGIGMVLGPLVLLRWSQRVNPAYLLLVSIFLLAGGTLVTGLAPTLAVALIAQTVGGIGNGLENIANDTLIQRTVPRAMLGRIFGIVYSGAFLASSLAYAVGGPLIDRTSPRMVFFIAGTGVLAALVVVWIMLPKDAAFYTVSP